MSTREELIKELDKEIQHWLVNNGFDNIIIHFQEGFYVSDILMKFVIEDRKKVVEPLVKFHNGKDFTSLTEAYASINEASIECLKNARVEI